MIPLRHGPDKSDSQRQKVEWWLLRAGRWRKWELLINEYSVSVTQ
jgi:hypothetical protein